jgi:hypothetical protein
MRHTPRHAADQAVSGKNTLTITLYKTLLLNVLRPIHCSECRGCKHSCQGGKNDQTAIFAGSFGAENPTEAVILVRAQ